MSMATQQFNQICQAQLDAVEKEQRHDRYYLDEKYDVKFIFTPVDIGRNMLKRVMNAFRGMMNRTSRLPKYLIVMLDEDFTKITVDYKTTEKAKGWIMGNIFQAIG